MIFYIKWCENYTFRTNDKYCHYMKIYAYDEAEAISVLMQKNMKVKMDYYEIVKKEKPKTIFDHLKIMTNKTEKVQYVA